MNETIKPDAVTSNGTPLKLLTGGPGHNWLADYPVGTVFAAKDKMNREATFLANQFEIVTKNAKTYILASTLNEPTQYISVIPLQFSIRFEMVDLVHDPRTIEDADTGTE